MLTKTKIWKPTQSRPFKILLCVTFEYFLIFQTVFPLDLSPCDHPVDPDASNQTDSNLLIGAFSTKSKQQENCMIFLETLFNLNQQSKGSLQKIGVNMSKGQNRTEQNRTLHYKSLEQRNKQSNATTNVGAHPHPLAGPEG